MLCSFLLSLAALAGGCLAPVTAFRETEPVPHAGDAADDPAGESAYAVYRRGAMDRYVTTFRVGRGLVDGVSDTDGLAATTLPLGPDFPLGLFVVQDGSNRGGNQNFKLVRWDLGAIAG